MNKAKNFLLMLKQGIKGVFKFKAQFIIIIILAFIATFILSISLSTQRNMQDSFDQIVKPVKRFDYSGNIQINSSADNNSDPFIVATELDASSSTNFEMTDNQGKHPRDVTAFNFVYYNKDNVYKDVNGAPIDTFITEGTQKFLDNHKANDEAVVEVQGYDTDHKANIQAYKWSSIEGKDGLYNAYMQALFTQIKQISDAAAKGTPLSSDKLPALKYSSMGIFTYKNPNWFNKFAKEDNGTFTFDWDFDGTTQYKDVFNNAALGVADLLRFLDYQLSQYNMSQLNPDQRTVKTDGKLIKSDADAESFLFGSTSSSISTDWELTDDNAYAFFPNYDGAKQKWDKDYSKRFVNSPAVSDPTKGTANINAAVYKAGLRGISNPFVNTTPDQSNGSVATNIDPSYLINWDNYAGLSISPDTAANSSQNLYEILNLDTNWYAGAFNESGAISIAENQINWDATTSMYGSVFRTHNVLAAEAAGFQYKLRREQTYFDANNQLKFRAIVLDPHEDYNFTLLRGRFPAQTGEIAINEQFASKNNLEVGSIMHSGDANLVVSAIATDAMSFLPSQDLSDPIPNPKVSAFVYANATTIDMIDGGTAVSDHSDNSVTQTLSYFLYDKENNKSTIEQRKNAYFALLSNNAGSAIQNYKGVQQFVNTGKITASVGSNISLDSFDKSGYRYSYTLEPLVFKAYDAVTFTAAAIIAIIAIIAIAVCVKKTIDFNSKQIGILKALGENPGAISSSYLSYSLIIMFVVVPIAWIVGVVLQIPFSHMFITYFSVEPQTIMWDWISFVIAFGVLGVLSAVISLGTAMFLTKKPVLSILVSSVKWGHLWFIDMLKKHVFNKAPFTTRFSLTLTSSGSKQIVLMTVVMFIASLFMSICLAIPSVVAKVNSSYYASVKYSNLFGEIPMTGNAPLSRNSISYWNGHDYLDSQYVGGDKKLALDTTGAKYGYYKDPEAYVATVSDSNTIGQYFYDATDAATDATKAKIADVDQYIMNHQSQILDIVGTMYGNNFFTHLGTSFSVGTVDKLYGVLLHSLTDVTKSEGSQGYGDVTNDDKKIAEAQSLSGWLTQSIPKIIGTIVNSNATSNENSSTDAGVKAETWKEKVMDTIYKVVPSYVKAYVQKSDSRLDQYAIAFQNDFFIPGQETLTTTVDNSDSMIEGSPQQMTLTGLDKYQNSIIVNKDDMDDVYLPNDVKQKLYKVLNPPTTTFDDTAESDVVYKGIKLYDHTTHSITLPVLPNQQAASAYKLDDGQQYNGWNSKAQMIQFRYKDLNKSFDLPSQAWVYDDSSFANYLKDGDGKSNMFKADNQKIPAYTDDNKYSSDDPSKPWLWDTTTNGKTFFNPTYIDTNKISYTQTFNTDASGKENWKNGMKDRALLFKDFKYNKDGQPIGTYVRPYYEYRNMKMILPLSWVDEQNLLWPSGKSHTLNGKETKQWYDDTLTTEDVPQSVVDSYKKLAAANGLTDPSASNSKWISINPYDTNYYQQNCVEGQVMALNNLVAGPGYWYRYCLEGNTQLSMNSAERIQDIWHNQGAPSDLKINLKSVGTIDSYNDKLIVVDSDLANKLANYPTNRDYEYNYQTFNVWSHDAVKAGDKDSNGNSSLFDRYPLFDPNSDKASDNPVYAAGQSFVNDDWTKDNDLQSKELWSLSYPDYIKAIGGNQNIANYAPHAYYNGKLSNIDEALNFTSQISFTKNPRWGQAAISLGDSVGGGTPSIIQTSTLLSTTKELISQIATLAIAIGAMLMIAIIITAALLTMLTGDIYIAQYRRFMVLLRALGYSKTQVFTYTFGTVTILALIAWIGGTILAWGLVFIAVTILWNNGFAIPMGITWWPIVISFVVMFLSYFGSLYVSSGKARKESPSVILTATAE